MLGGSVLLLVALLAALLVAFQRGVWQRAPLPRQQPEQGALLSVPAARVLEEPWKLGAAPFLVTGLPPTPQPEDWERVWGCATVKTLLTPDGLVGAYGRCEQTVVMGTDGRLDFGEKPCRFSGCSPRHAVHALSLQAALLVFANPASAEPWASHAYLRGTCPSPVREQIARATFGSDAHRLRNLAPYLSSTGTTTNLHWDGNPGVLAQTGGSKLVHLYAPGGMPQLEENRNSPCWRRSREDGAEAPPGAAMRLELHPGDAVYIPAYWGHHILSLSPRTLGAVWRFSQRGDADQFSAPPQT